MSTNCPYCDAYRSPDRTHGYDPFATRKGAKWLPCDLCDFRMTPAPSDARLLERIHAAAAAERVARAHYRDARMAEAQAVLLRELRAIAAARGIDPDAGDVIRTSTPEEPRP